MAHLERYLMDNILVIEHDDNDAQLIALAVSQADAAGYELRGAVQITKNNGASYRYVATLVKRPTCP